MAEAKRETRTVETTVTVLELSGPEVTALADTLTGFFNGGYDLPPEVHDIRDALKGAADPIAVGDKIRVLRDHANHTNPDRDGERGVVTEVGRADPDYPYTVRYDSDGFETIVHRVERVER